MVVVGLRPGLYDYTRLGFSQRSGLFQRWSVARLATPCSPDHIRASGYQIVIYEGLDGNAWDTSNDMVANQASWPTQPSVPKSV